MKIQTKEFGDWIESRKELLLMLGIALVIGMLLKGFTILLVLIAILIYTVGKRRGWITSKSNGED